MLSFLIELAYSRTIMAFNLQDSIQSVKNAFFQALQSIDEFRKETATGKGDIVDANFKSMLKDLMDQFGMTPGVDYLDYRDNDNTDQDTLRPNEPGADFVIYSEEANNLLKDLLVGNITVVKEHTRVYKSGKIVTIDAHYRRLR